jgi:flavodoxin
MKRALVLYFSKTGTTEQMAQYIAEGIRIAGGDADVKPVSEIKDPKDLSGCDAYILGSPTYHLDTPPVFQAFLALAEKAGLQGKIGGAFSSRGHPSSSEDSAARHVFAMMEAQFHMSMTNLVPFDLKADLIDQPEGMRACHDYGKAIGQMLG